MAASFATPLSHRRRLIVTLLAGILAVQAITVGVFGVSAWNSGHENASRFAERTIDLASVTARSRV